MRGKYAARYAEGTNVVVLGEMRRNWIYVDHQCPDNSYGCPNPRRNCGTRSGSASIDEDEPARSASLTCHVLAELIGSQESSSQDF